MDDRFVNRIFVRDCAAGLMAVPDASAPLSVTSPPFDVLRDYGRHPFDFEMIASELYRVIIPGGVLVWVVQEQIEDGEESGTAHEQKRYFKEIGFTAHASLILVSNYRPIPQPRRYACTFQYAWVMSKGRPRHVNIIKDRPNSTAGERIRGNVRLKDGRIQKRRRTGKITGPFGFRTNIWTYDVGGNKTTRDDYAFGHPALMPELMAEDLILSWSRPGDLILDPFCGAGTTCKMALLNDRRYLGFEAHEPYAAIAHRRMLDAKAAHIRRLDGWLSRSGSETPEILAANGHPISSSASEAMVPARGTTARSTRGGVMSSESANRRTDHPGVGASRADDDSESGGSNGNDEVTAANVAPLGAAASPADPNPIQEAVGGRNGSSQEEKLTNFIWKVEHGARHNFKKLGVILDGGGDLYRNGEDGIGLIRVSPGGKPRTIAKGSELAPLIADRLRMIVKKEGKILSELPKAEHLNAMLRSESFLACFRPVDQVVGTPYYLDDFTLARPGYRDDGPGRRIVYTGPVPAVCQSLDTIRSFLGVMDFASNADRTNAVAAALTVLLRNHWPGEKPVVLITATKSHAGKGTITEFIRGSVAKADILYESLDWPMQCQFQRQVKADPEVGVVILDNVRLDSAGGRCRVIRSAFLEAFVTNREIVLASPGAGDPIRLSNRFVVLINSNDGSISTDLLNRALSIHLAPKGSISERRSPIGNPKLEYLPRNRARIEAELRGMIERWRAAGRPMYEAASHSMTPWARAIGGILKVNGFADFLGNQSGRRDADDPVRMAVGMLGVSRPGKPLRPIDWARVAVEQGLVRTLIPVNEREAEKGRERAIGVLLKPLVGETFEAATESRRYLLRLDGGIRRWVPGRNPHVRYRFEVIEEEGLVDEGRDPQEDGAAGNSARSSTSDSNPRGPIPDTPHGLGQDYQPQPDRSLTPSQSSKPQGPYPRPALESKPLDPATIKSSKPGERFMVFQGDDRGPAYFLLATSEEEANAFARRQGDDTRYVLACPTIPREGPCYDATPGKKTRHGGRK